MYGFNIHIYIYARTKRLEHKYGALLRRLPQVRSLLPDAADEHVSKRKWESCMHLCRRIFATLQASNRSGMYKILQESCLHPSFLAGAIDVWQHIQCPDAWQGSVATTASNSSWPCHARPVPARVPVALAEALPARLHGFVVATNGSRFEFQPLDTTGAPMSASFLSEPEAAVLFLQNMIGLCRQPCDLLASILPLPPSLQRAIVLQLNSIAAPFSAQALASAALALWCDRYQRADQQGGTASPGENLLPLRNSQLLSDLRVP